MIFKQNLSKTKNQDWYQQTKLQFTKYNNVKKSGRSPIKAISNVIFDFPGFAGIRVLWISSSSKRWFSSKSILAYLFDTFLPDSVAPKLSLQSFTIYLSLINEIRQSRAFYERLNRWLFFPCFLCYCQVFISGKKNGY